MIRSPWKRTSPWLAVILLGISLLPPVAMADGGIAAAAETEGLTAQASAAAAPVLLSGSSHTLLIQPGGVVWAWGNNEHGQSGGSNSWVNVEPVLVPALPVGVKAVAGGEGHSLAIGPDGAVWAWGMNYAGQVDPDTSRDYSPHKLKIAGVAAIAAGAMHSLALKSGGVLGWGANDRGQLGNGTWTQALTPVAVQGLSKVTAIASGSDHSLALKSDGSVWAWGANSEGAVGDGTQTDRAAPVKVAGLPRIAKVAAGGATSFALTADGTLWGWGRNQEGELGNGSFTDQPVPIQLMSNVAQVAPGSGHTLVLKKDGTVWAVGSNDSGQLGFTGANNPTPAGLGDLTGASSLAAGAGFSLAVRANGTVYGWGSNSHGELGAGESPEATPEPVPALVGVALTNPVPFEGVIRVATNKVTLNGLTYPKATVTAELADGTTKSAVADAGGKFALKDLTFPSAVETSVSLRATTAAGPASTTHVMSVYVDDRPPQVEGVYLRLIDSEGNQSTPELTQTGTTYSGTVTAAAETVLHATVDEPVSKITVSPAAKQITNGSFEFDITLGDLKKGANQVNIEVTDLVGKKSKLTLQLNYEAGPVMTISTPRSNPAFGAPKNGASTIPVEFKGTADEKVATLLVVDADTGSEVTHVDMTGALSTSWKITIDHDAIEAGVWKYRFLGVDQAGYTSKPSATNADVRIVTIDPLAPQISFTSPYDQLVFTDGDDDYLGVVNKQLVIAGEAYDEHSGIKQVTAGSAKAMPARNSDPHNLTFSLPISLKDNALTTVQVSAEDLMGNKSEPTTYWAVMKTKINKLSASGNWTKSTDLLKVTGATDPAINIGSKNEPIPVGVVEWGVFQEQVSAASGGAHAAQANPDGLPAGATLIARKSREAAAQGGVSAQASCWDYMKGTFSCNFDTSGMADGTYNIYVVAFAPAEFPDLKARVVKFRLTIHR
ncbi:MAG: chromosome condensation regulator [Firmicutes bacterium]|nr:chromosome condensation regulator [Bacillota bacterium]